MKNKTRKRSEKGRSVCVAHPTDDGCRYKAVLLLKPVPSLGRASIDAPLVGINGLIARGPTQEKRRPERKNDRLSINVCFDAFTLRVPGKRERQSVAKDYWVRPVLGLIHHGPKYLGLQ